MKKKRFKEDIKAEKQEVYNVTLINKGKFNFEISNTFSMSLDNILEESTFFKDQNPPFQLFLKNFHVHSDEFNALQCFIQHFP
jgi:hypothetical protein